MTHIKETMKATETTGETDQILNLWEKDFSHYKHIHGIKGNH